MTESPATWTILIIVWIISVYAGVTFIRSAFVDRQARDTRFGKAVQEVQFRLRLAFGIALLIWVISGLIWVYANWL